MEKRTPFSQLGDGKAFATAVEYLIRENGQTQIVWANKTACDLAGLPLESTVGRDCCVPWGQAGDSSRVCPAVAAMETGHPQELEATTPDGRTWLIRAYPLADKQGQPLGAIKLGLDIGDCASAERDRAGRRSAEEAYRALVDHSLQGLVIIQDMRIVFANQAMAEISGYSVEEILDASSDLLRDFIHVQDRERVWRHHEGRLENQPLPDRYAFRVMHKGGSTRWLEIHTNRVEYRGQPAIQAACIDVTDRYQAEQALRRSEARNRALLSAIPDLMFRLSAGGVFLDCKPPREDSLPVSPSQFLGRHLTEVFSPATAGHLIQCIGRTLENGGVETLEYSLPGPNGQECAFECRLAACAEQEVLAIVRDITERRRAEFLQRLQRDVAVRLSSLSNLGEALHYSLEAAVTTSQMDCGGIHIVDSGAGCVNLAAHMGLSAEFLRHMSSYPIDSRFARLAMAGEPVYARYDDLPIPLGPIQRQEGLRATGVVPIRHDNRVIAFLMVASHSRKDVPQWSRTVLEAITAQLGSAISRLRAEEALAERLAFETLVSSLSATFVNLPTDSIDAEIELGLARIGESLGIDRSVVIQLASAGGDAWVTHAWARPGLKRTPDNLRQHVRLEWSMERILQGEVLALPRAEEWPPEAEDERQYCIREGIKSVIAIPLSVGGSTLGVVSFSSLRTHRTWSEPLIQRLRMVGEILANALLRKRSEEALRDSETRLRSIIRAAPVGIGVACNRVLLSVNGRVCEMLGYSHEELVGCDARVLYPSEEVYEYVGRVNYQQIAEHGTGTLETRWRRKDGQIIDVLLSSTPLDLADLSQGVMFTALDITARKKAEEELRNIFDLSLDLVCIVDIREARFTKVNPAFSKRLGYTEQELTERSFLEFVHPEDVDKTVAVLRDKLLAGEELINFENRYRSKDGSYRWLSWTSHPVPEQGLSYAVAHDVTGRKETEQALKASDIRFRSLIEQTTDAVFCYEYDPPIPTDLPVDEQVKRFHEGVLVECNDVAARSYGAARAEDVIGRRLNQLFRVIPKGLDDFFQQFILAQYHLVNAEASDVSPDGGTQFYVSNGHGVVEDGHLVHVWGAIRDVTEHRRAVVALGESERRYRELYEGSRDASAAVDQDGRIVECNSIFLDMLGYSKAEVYALTYEDITPAKWHAQEARILREQVSQRGYSDLYEKEYIRRDGSVFPVELRAYINKDDSGKMTGMWALIRDITERKQAEQMLRFTQFAVDHTRDSAFWLDADGTFVYVNEAAARFLGYSRDELLRMSVHDIDLDFPAEVWPAHWRELQERGSLIFESRHRTKDGRVFLVEVTANFVVFEGRGYNCAFARDITERKRAELALRDSESRFRDLADLLPQTVFETDTEGCFTYVNRAGRDTFGYEDQRVRSVSVRQVLAPADRDRAMYNLRNRMTGGPFGDHEYTALSKDGRMFPVLLYCSPIIRGGRAVGLRGIVFDITERKRVEQRLQELRNIIDRSPVLVFLWRVEFGRWPVEFVSENVVRLLGYTADDFMSGRVTWPSITHPEDVPRLEAEVARFLEEGERTWSQEYRLITRSGDVRWFMDENLALVDETGTVTHIQSILIDSTERKQMEEALQDSERKYRELYEGSRDGTATTDLTGRVLQCNTVFAEMLGYGVEEFTRLTVWDFMPPERVEQDKRLIYEQVHARGYSDVFEKEYIRKDGSVFPVELRVYLTRDIAGRPVGMWAIARDISDRRRSEQALQASERNYREIFNAANESIFIHDANTGEILDVNETMVRMFGYSRDQALKLRVEDLSSGESPYSQEEALQRVRKAGEEGPQVFEWHARRRNGELFWLEVDLKSVVIGGELVILAATRDITERKKADVEAQQHLAELTRAWHANTLGELASGLAHELNQPLCAILNYSGGCLRLSRRRDFSIDTLRNSIEQIAAQAERAAAIIKRIRGLITKHEPQRSALDLDAVLNNAVRMLHAEAAESGVTVVLNPAPALPRAKSDSVEIEQVVLNLMRNAIEAMSDAQVTDRILTISTRLLDDRELEVTVADTGRGLSPELAERIFDSFFTTKPQGLGIGLALSRRIVEVHGGRLWVESDGRSGAAFRFTLPVEGAAYGKAEPHGFRSR